MDSTQNRIDDRTRQRLVADNQFQQSMAKLSAIVGREKEKWLNECCISLFGAEIFELMSFNGASPEHHVRCAKLLESTGLVLIEHGNAPVEEDKSVGLHLGTTSLALMREGNPVPLFAASFYVEILTGRLSVKKVSPKTVVPIPATHPALGIFLRDSRHERPSIEAAYQRFCANRRQELARSIAEGAHGPNSENQGGANGHDESIEPNSLG